MMVKNEVENYRKEIKMEAARKSRLLQKDEVAPLSKQKTTSSKAVSKVSRQKSKGKDKESTGEVSQHHATGDFSNQFSGF